MVSYHPRSKNGKADALSRQFEVPDESEQPDLILPATTMLAPVQWDLIEKIRRAHADEPPPIGCPPHKLFVPQQFRPQVMQWVHGAPSSGHPGTRRSTQLISHRFWWPSLGPDVERYVQQCSTCAQARTSRQHPEGLLVPLPIPRRPWSHLSVDFLTDLPDSGGFMAAMVVVDRFSKGCKLVPLKGLLTAMQTVEAMFCHVFRNFGLPEDIVSDRGPQFTSRVCGSLCDWLEIAISLSSSHHPQSNGQAERLNQEIGRFLRSYCSREQQRWSEFLLWAEYARNSLTHSSTGLMPFQCMLGYQPPLFPWSGEPSDVPSVEEWYRRSQEVWEWAHVRLQRSVRRQRIQADRHRRPHPAYQVGQRVWLSTWNLRLKLPCRKLSPKFIGPFAIICQVNPVAYHLRLPASYSIYPTFHVSLLKPAHSSAGEPVASEDPPPPLDIEGSPGYQVQSLLNSRWQRSRLQYLVDWEGYGPEERSWVDAADILDPSLIEDFHQDYPTRPAPRPRGHPRRRTPGGVPRGGGSVMTRPRTDREREPSPKDSSRSSLISINGTEVQSVSSFKFLCARSLSLSEDGFCHHITSALLGSCNSIPEESGECSLISTVFYYCSTESILTNSFTLWYGSCPVSERKSLGSLLRSTNMSLVPNNQLLHHRKAHNIRHSSHPSLNQIHLLTSRRRYRNIHTRTSFFSTSIMLLNSTLLHH
ncbi:hypothetical protein QTP86_007303 [Hemibagrus guttatus]|nr:hypothetical protein QTP86_007303 [Hemibagrus guttatus]